MPRAKRVLLYRLGSLGDHLIALPSYRLVRRAFPDAEIRLLTNVPVSAKAPAAAAVLEHTGLVQGYLRYVVGTRSLVELARLWWQIVRFRPDTLVYLAASRGIPAAHRDSKFFRLCSIRHQIGVPVTETLQQNWYGDSAGAAHTNNLEPEAARLARNIASLGDAQLHDIASWSLSLTEAERATASASIGALTSQVVAVSVGTKVQAKDWGRDNWRDLLAAVAAKYPNRTLLLAGAPEESDASEFAAEGWRANNGGPVINLCGKLTPRESAAALSQATLFIGHDSGPMHLAASVGTPVVAIFAARNIPRQWFPFGSEHRVAYHQVDCAGCGLETCIEQKKKCILSITVEEVMGLVSEAMEGNNAR